MPGAVLTRVASSHIRVGTFQYFAARQDVEALQALTDHVIARHYPDAQGALGLLDHVIAAQAKLIAQWMGVGFIHGVMNTDNCHVGGETIDYGPCAYLDAYHPDKVFSSIDQYGRYAYGRQPEIVVWNLAQLATSLLPLIDVDMDAAVEAATASVHRFPDLYSAAWLEVFRAKLGLETADPEDAALIDTLLARMATLRADFTNTFRGLAEGTARAQFSDPAAYDTWADLWVQRLTREGHSPEGQRAALRAANPAVIARNHQVEAAIQASLTGNYSPFFKLNEVLGTPYDLAPENAAFAKPPRPEQEVRQTFCGT